MQDGVAMESATERDESLNSSQKFHLLTSCKYVDKLLSEIESILAASTSSPLAQYRRRDLGIRGQSEQVQSLQGTDSSLEKSGGRMLSKGPARKVCIYVNEDTRSHMTPLYEAILTYLLHKGVAGATAFRAMAGFGA